MRALLVYYAWGLQLIRCLIHNTYALLLPLTKLFLVFKMKISSTNIVIHASFASLCEGLIFYIIVESVYIFFLSQKQTLVSTVCIDSYMLLIALVILLCVDNYPWDIHVQVESNRWNLYLPLCCFNAFTLNLLLYE